MKRIAMLAALVMAGSLMACDRNARSDTSITADIEHNLHAQNLPDTISVSTSSGVVTLAGLVPDVHEKGRAESVAQDVKGVHQVINNLHARMAGDAPVVRPPDIAPPPPAVNQAAPQNAPMPNAPQIPPDVVPEQHAPAGGVPDGR